MDESAYELSEKLRVTPMWRRKSRLFEVLKTGLLGALCGAVAAVALGFTLGGWVTPEIAEERAQREAAKQVLATKVRICIRQFKLDPERERVLSEIADVQVYARPLMVARAGWATMPGAEAPDAGVAHHCADAINAALQQGRPYDERWPNPVLEPLPDAG